MSIKRYELLVGRSNEVYISMDLVWEQWDKSNQCTVRYLIDIVEEIMENNTLKGDYVAVQMNLSKEENGKIKVQTIIEGNSYQEVCKVCTCDSVEPKTIYIVLKNSKYLIMSPMEFVLAKVDRFEGYWELCKKIHIEEHALYIDGYLGDIIPRRVNKFLRNRMNEIFPGRYPYDKLKRYIDIDIKGECSKEDEACFDIGIEVDIDGNYVRCKVLEPIGGEYIYSIGQRNSNCDKKVRKEKICFTVHIMKYFNVVNFSEPFSEGISDNTLLKEVNI